MRANSLAFRLFASAAAWTLVVLPVTAFLLVSLYRQALERNFDARLNVYLTSLVASSTEEGAPTPTDPADFGQPIFGIPFSGWYWQIKPLGKGTRPDFVSDSLLDQQLKLPSANGVKPDASLTRRAHIDGPNRQRLRIVEREIRPSGANSPPYSYAVAGDSTEIDRDLAAFTTMLIAALAVAGLGLVAATFFQVRFGLSPLRAIRERLAAIRSGEAEKLEGELPLEIKPLQQELNALIQSNREIVERARTHVGNLAHALKTPLSVMVNEAAARPEDPLASKVAEQTNIMRDQVARHLERARLAARVAVVGTVTDVVPVVQALTRTMEKTHHGKDLAVALDVPGEARFRGERQDLEEMVGNLVDNAFKWASARVAVEVGLEQPEPGRQSVRIVVDDDGPGLTPAQREQVARRGRRLDETKPGSGLGLSIVVELAALYGGALNLGTAPIGGLRAELVLPAAG
jgi:signal transduction histidine kinase